MKNQFISKSLLLSAFVLILIGCKKNENIDLPNLIPPVVETSEVGNIFENTATCGGIVTAVDGQTIIAKGVCWSTNTQPTINDSITKEVATLNTFTSTLRNLNPKTTYYVRAYATTSTVTVYGNTTVFVSPDFIQDLDRNVYHSVTIGTQTWMIENLKTTKYRNGDAISNVTKGSTWENLITGAWCNYKNDAAIGKKYGRLYNWYAVGDSRNIAPTGWHVPSDAEWRKLLTYVAAHLGGSPSVAKALAATTDWDFYTGIGSIGNDLTQNNSSFFSALPGGEFGAASNFLGSKGFWWCSTVYSSVTLNYDYSGVDINYCDKFYGCSVRCIKD